MLYRYTFALRDRNDPKAPESRFITWSKNLVEAKKMLVKEKRIISVIQSELE